MTGGGNKRNKSMTSEKEGECILTAEGRGGGGGGRTGVGIGARRLFFVCVWKVWKGWKGCRDRARSRPDRVILEAESKRGS